MPFFNCIIIILLSQITLPVYYVASSALPENITKLSDEFKPIILLEELKSERFSLLAEGLIQTFSGSRTCKEGTIYTVKEGEDLTSKYYNELECVFFAGLTPSSMPLGPLYGHVAKILNSRLLSPISSKFWWGKLLTEVPCQDAKNQKLFMGFNNIRNLYMIPFLANLEPINLDLAPGEYNDKKPTMYLDYTLDFSKMCQFPDNEPLWAGVRGQNVFPINHLIDVLRLVGVQEDGGRIYLGKTYFKDVFMGTYSTVLYFYLINYDMNVNPDFVALALLPPLTPGFTY